MSDGSAAQLFPRIELLDYSRAVSLALQKLTADQVETSWTGALSTSHDGSSPVRLTTEKGMIIERRQIVVDASPQETFRAFTGIGGEHGWFYMNWAWRLRGALDRLCGGVGLRRGRRAAVKGRVGVALECWGAREWVWGHQRAPGEGDRCGRAQWGLDVRDAG